MTFAQASAQDFLFNLGSFKLYQSETKSENRAIEGSSPILGHLLAMEMKHTMHHPEEIYLSILNNNPNFEIDVYKSSNAYFGALSSGLDEYCSDKVVTGDRSQWTSATGNHGAAIPQEVIGPVTSDYLTLLEEEINKSTTDKETYKENSVALALDFQERRYQCPNVQKLVQLENRLEKFCIGLGFCVNARKLNSIISSAEAAYPRKQFSINGFTRYVYNELLQTQELERKLKVVYDAEVKWLELKNAQATDVQFFEYVIDQSIEADIHIKDVMLILAYSMRNMPSLDIEYALNPKRALLLEAYFWRFRDLRDILSKRDYFEYVFPDHEFKRDPGFYHYLTAALLGCEARLAGQSHFVAKMLGMISKVGYKVDKLIKSIDRSEYDELSRREKIKYLRGNAKQQGMWPGITAGYHAAKFGSRACQSYKRDLKRESRQQLREGRKEIRRDTSLSRKERREKIKALKSQMKEELKLSFRSILDDEDYLEDEDE